MLKHISVDITYTLPLTRKSPSYKAIIITPAFGGYILSLLIIALNINLGFFAVIILLTLLNFWLPPQAGEKILLNGCTAIMICIFLLYFTQKFPAMGNNTPLVGEYCVEIRAPPGFSCPTQ